MSTLVPPSFDSKATTPSPSVTSTLHILQGTLDKKRGISKPEDDLWPEGYVWDIEDPVERRFCVQWLTHSIEWATKRSILVGDSDDWTWIMDTAAMQLAELCGKGASGKVKRSVKVWGPDAEELPGVIINEPSFVEADVGCQTWGSATLMARRISRHDIPVRQFSSCLELGSGTGLAGMVLARELQHVGGVVVMTDYLASLLDVLTASSRDNSVDDGTAQIRHLDWFEVAQRMQNAEAGVAAPKANYSDVTAQREATAGARQLDVAGMQRGFSLVVAADVLYELEHAKVIPILADYFLATSGKVTPRFVVTTPLRATHKKEVSAFEAEMAKIGSLRLVARDDTTLADDLSGWVERVGAAETEAITQTLTADANDTWRYRTYIFERC
ncbi:hypothetical protein DL89DRAFT_16985 [Linderina pennispora]|uniref:S-adenosyl-L-methionine-dependent methyltransferase n=1 Tax=Linderina pennispora TaxID=61395 RepID=A0A1Y1WMZ7_9FUNG|nr:uncharacterized protein DL89DRAFT_16985 [Linderina pennispora]ORX74484.1 hypothetical protein DL89DRAFT_16985 [Linderina pennispora]